MERLSLNSDTRSGFQIPQYHKKKQRRYITGKKSITSVRGAPGPSRYLFIYRVHTDTTVAEMSAFMEEQSVTPRSLECVSHEEAKFKSFKLEVAKDDYEKLLEDDDFWPNGVRIQRFNSPRKDNNDANSENWR